MSKDELEAGLKAVAGVAAALPQPLGAIVSAALAVASAIVELGIDDPTARLEEIRILLRRGIDADVNEHLNRETD